MLKQKYFSNKQINNRIFVKNGSNEQLVQELNVSETNQSMPAVEHYFNSVLDKYQKGIVSS